MSATVEAIRTNPGVALEDLPQPKRFYILVKMLDVSEKVNANSRIVMPENRKADEEVANPLAEVILMGPECFSGPEFPTGAACQPGDIILMAPYSGQRVIVGPNLDADEYRIITHHVVTAVVPRPELVRRGL